MLAHPVPDEMTRVSCRLTRVTVAQGHQYIVAWARDAHIQCGSREFFLDIPSQQQRSYVPIGADGWPTEQAVGRSPHVCIYVDVTIAYLAYAASPSRTS
jgi:hypothetical protein